MTRPLRALAPAGAAALLCGALLATGLLARTELGARDRLLRLLPARPAGRVAAVLVDEESLRALGPWPWERERLAALVTRIGEAGAKGVAVDVLLPEARPGDDTLAAALARVPSALAAALDARGWILPAPALSRVPRAHVSFEVEGDGVVRSLLSTKQDATRSFPALALAAARLGRPELAVPVARPLRPGFRVRPEEVPAVGAAALLAEPRYAGVLAGRLVFFGASAAGIGDRVVTPVSGAEPVPGVLVQAAAAEAILAGDLLRPAPPLLAALLAGLVAALAVEARARRGRAGLPLAAGAALLPFPAGYGALLLFHAVLPAVAMSIAALATVGGAELLIVRALRRRGAAHVARIAELQRLARELEGLRREEAEARRVVAHELKTPLTSVRGLAQLLEGFPLDEEERRRVAGMVVTETARLAEMVEALLDLERLKLKDFGASAARVDLSALAAERVAALRAGAGREIAAEIAPGVTVRGDAALLARALENLAGNAVKFSPGGAPVTVRVARAGESALLEVEDEGPGVPEEARERVFRRFERGSASAAVPGLGLGLALVAEVAAWHGGSAEAARGAKGGGLFRVRLPLARGE